MAQKKILSTDDLEATPTNGETTKAPQSDWAYDHATDLAAHTKNFVELIKTGEYVPGYPWWYACANKTMSANVLYAMPFLAARNLTVDRIALDVNTGGAGGTKARIGIYNDGADLYPGTLLLDAGEVAVDGIGVQAIVISQALTEGLYWLVAVTDGAPTVSAFYASPTLLGVNSVDFLSPGCGWSKAFSYGALPTPFTAGGSILRDKTPCPQLRILSLD